MNAPRHTTRRHHGHSPGARVVQTAFRLLLSFGYLMLSAMLMLFGYIVGWDANPGHPLIGTLMIVAGIAIFLLGPRVIRRITGKDPIDPPPYGLL